MVRNYVPHTIETMYLVHLKQFTSSSKPYTLETMHFHQKFDKKWNNPSVFKNYG